MVSKKVTAKVFGNSRTGQMSINLPKKKFKKIKPGDIIGITIEPQTRGETPNDIKKKRRKIL